MRNPVATLLNALRIGFVGLIFANAFPATAQMSLRDVQPGMERNKVERELSKQYTDGYSLDRGGDSTSVTRWIEKDGKVMSVTPLGLVIYKDGRVDIVEEFYDDGSTEKAASLVQAIFNELRPYLGSEGPPKGHQSRHAATARIVLDEIADPELGRSDHSLLVMFGHDGIRVTLTEWKLGEEPGSYVELTRRREAAGK